MSVAPEPETTCSQVSFDLKKHVTRFTLINLINTISQRPCLDILFCENYFLLLLLLTEWKHRITYCDL